MAGPGAGPARKPGLRSGCDRSEEPPREAPEGGGRRERGPGRVPGRGLEGVSGQDGAGMRPLRPSAGGKEGRKEGRCSRP